MREIKAATVAETVRRLFLEANITADPAVCTAIKHARGRETGTLPIHVLDCLGENLNAAERTGLPICQDTGMAVVFVDMGVDVHLTGGYLQEAVDRGVSEAYLDGKMRCSIVEDPLYHRKNTDNNTPALIHLRQVPGDKMSITVAPKGFGRANISLIPMVSADLTEEDILWFVV